MGRAEDVATNAAMESFFALLQKNVLDRWSWAPRDELRIAIATWIERTYTDVGAKAGSENWPLPKRSNHDHTSSSSRLTAVLIVQQPPIMLPDPQWCRV